MWPWLGLLVVASVACKNKHDSPATSDRTTGSTAADAVGDAGQGSATEGANVAVADTAPPLPPFCIDDDDEEDATYRELAKTESTLTFCLQLEERAKCATLDLGSGSFASVPVPPPVTEPEGKPLDTSKLALPAGRDYATAVSPDGTTIAATTDLEGKLFLVDASTGKVKKVVSWSADGGCMEPPSFIGDHVYVQYNVCAGPGATGWIVTADGKKLGRLRYVNPTGTFYAIGDDRYAFEDFAGSGVEIVDGKKGKTVARIQIETPVDCDDCAKFPADALGLIQVGAKLVQLGGNITVIDPVAAKVERTIKWPRCETNPSAP
jgi:hypothetical protein